MFSSSVPRSYIVSESPPSTTTSRIHKATRTRATGRRARPQSAGRMRLAVNDEELEKVAFEANRRRRNGGLRKKTRPLSAGGKSQRRAYAVKRKMKRPMSAPRSPSMSSDRSGRRGESLPTALMESRELLEEAREFLLNRSHSLVSTNSPLRRRPQTAGPQSRRKRRRQRGKGKNTLPCTHSNTCFSN